MLLERSASRAEQSNNMTWRSVAAMYLSLVTMIASAQSVPSYESARAAMRALRFDEAENSFRALLIQAPENADYLLGLGQVLSARSRPHDAIPILEKALALAPRYLDVQQVLAGAYLAVGNRAGAHAIYRHARDQDPTLAWATTGLAAREEPTHRVTATTGMEATLNERHDTWREVGVGVDIAWPNRARVGARAARSERFDQDDEIFDLYGSVPVTERITIAGRGQFSPSGRARLETAGVVEATLALNDGWVFTLGGGRSIFPTSRSDLITTTLEHYFDQFRIGYTATLIKPQTIGWQAAHRWFGSVYYGTDSAVSLSLAYGVETDETLVGAAAAKFDSWGAGFNGRHWLTAGFGLDYALGYNGLESPRGDHLDRTTFYVGIAVRY